MALLFAGLENEDIGVQLVGALDATDALLLLVGGQREAVVVVELDLKEAASSLNAVLMLLEEQPYFDVF